MNTNSTSSIIILLIVFLLSPGIHADGEKAPSTEGALQENISGAAAPEESSSNETKSHIVITADRMEMLMGQTIRLEGNVKAEDSKMTLTSNRMLIFLASQTPDNVGEAQAAKGGIGIDRIEANGSVAVRTADGKRSATGDQGLYIKKDEIIVLEGNCTIMVENNLISSNKVVYDRKSDTISTGGRSSVVLPSESSADKSSTGLESFFVPKAKSKE